MGETPSSHAPPQLQGLTIEAVEWLPSGADSGLVRVRGRWTAADAAVPGLPELVLRSHGLEHRFESLPDARFARDPASWRGSYLVPVAQVTGPHDALWVEWAGGVRSGLPPLAPGLGTDPALPAAPPPAAEPEPEGGQVIDHAVLAERRARRAEAAEQAQARVAAEALRAVEALELQSAELERRLAEAIAERDALAAAPPASLPAEPDALAAAPPASLPAEPDALAAAPPASLPAEPDALAAAPPASPHVEAAPASPPTELAELAERRQAALAGALESLARLRGQSREWRLRLRTGEIAHAGDAVRLAVLEAERATGAQATREELHRRVRELAAERATGAERAAELAAARDDAARAREQLEALREESSAGAERARAELESVRTEAARSQAELERVRTEAARSQAELVEAREQAESRLIAAAAASEESLRELEQRRRGEHAVHEEVREALDRRLAETTARATALEAAHAELVAARGTAEARASELRARVTELEAVLATTETKLHAATTAAATHETRLRVESVARAALEDELDRARAAQTQLTAERDAAHTDRDVLAADLSAVTSERDALAADRDAAVAARDDVAADLASARTSFAAELEAERGRRAAAEAAIAETGSRYEAEVAEARAALDAALAERDAALAELEAERQARANEGGAFHERIAGLTAEVRLEQAAREQAEAAAAAARRPEAESGRMVADLDAAAAALREAAEPPDAAPAPDTVEAVELPEAVEAVEPPAVAAPPEAVEVAEPPAVAAPPEAVEVAEPPAAAPAAEEVVPAAVAPEVRVRPRIVSATGPPPRVDAIGRSARQYPPLRGAIVKLAHDDPVTAGRLIAALLPAQSAALANGLDYDLTIKGVGTFSVTVAGTWTHVKQLTSPRPRGQSDFHLRADALTLAELLAGVNRRVGRFFGSARFSGSRRRLNVLRALPATRLTLAEAARAGAHLDPALVYRALSYAVHPSWTRGERFTIAQVIESDPPETWYLTARNGAGLAVSAKAPQEPPHATVAMTREAFDLLLRGEPVPRGSRPAVRGDRHAVARMKAWTDRAQGLRAT